MSELTKLYVNYMQFLGNEYNSINLEKRGCKFCKLNNIVNFKNHLEQ